MYWIPMYYTANKQVLRYSKGHECIDDRNVHELDFDGVEWNWWNFNEILSI